MMLAIAHGGGALNGVPYTNSFEALEVSYALGFRWFELDFKQTVDGRIGCRHDWSEFGDVAPSLNDLRGRFEDRFTPVDAESLAAWMTDRPDVTLVTDVKEADQLPVLADLKSAGVPPARTVVQLFAPEEADGVATLGYERRTIILYRYQGDRDQLVLFLEQGGAQAVAMSLDQARAGLLHELPPLPAWVYTVNRTTDIRRLSEEGVSGVFTDDLPPGHEGLEAVPTHSLFVYGTLRDPAVRRRVFGHDLPSRSDAVVDYEKGLLACRDDAAIGTSGIVQHPVVRPQSGSIVEGEVLTLSDADLIAADTYEDVDYARVPVRLRSGSSAWLYVERPA